ncbi:MAG: hypothetical protein AB9835_14375 [Eubacteriales bacterium]
MTYTTAARSIQLLQSCPDDQLQRIRDKSDKYITESGDKHDVRVNRTIQHVCKGRGI